MNTGTIESVTAGKLLQEFIRGYDEEPFGEQGLVIVTQLLKKAFPNQPLKQILASEELCDLLNTALALYKFRNQPIFLAFMGFIMEKSQEELQEMDGSQLKKEMASLLDTKTSLSPLEIERSAYDLSGNPESASLARTLLEGALISTTASLFSYLLIEGENHAGKFFRDLDNTCRFIADRIRKINSIFIFIRELLNFKWRRVSIAGSLPTLKELGIEDICLYVEEHPHDYLEYVKEKFCAKLDAEFRNPLHFLIESCQVQIQNREDFPELEIELELLQTEKIKNKLIQDLKKLQSRFKAGKKVSIKEVEELKEDFSKDYEKLKEEISKEFSNFQKNLERLLSQEPPWFKFHKIDTKWELEASQMIFNELNEQLSITQAFRSQKKSRTLQKAVAIFEQLGGIHFAIENIIAHSFYECVPSRLVKLVETPAKRQKIKELKFLQEKRYNEGLESVKDFLVPYSETIISNLLTSGISVFENAYIKDNAFVCIDEEKPRHPRYLDLLDIPKEFFSDNPPESFFGDEYFIFQTNDRFVTLGFFLKSLHGRGNDLFKLLVSSTALKNAETYRSATKILGNFSGYVNSTAIGNFQVCPPALKAIDDLFM